MDKRFQLSEKGFCIVIFAQHMGLTMVTYVTIKGL